MRQSTFDPCLLYTDKRGLFNKLGLQTDDTLFLANEEFAMILGNPVEVLLPPNPLLFNGDRLVHENDSICLTQKVQADQIKLADATNPLFARGYIEQQALGAYIASTCQAEAAFDLSLLPSTFRTIPWQTHKP